MISLNKRIESLSQKVSTLSYKDDVSGGSQDNQEDLKNIQNNMQAIMNAVKVGYIGENAETVKEIYFQRSSSKQRYPKDCSEVKPKSIKDAKISRPGIGPKIPAKSGLYKIQPDPLQPPFLALCDMDTDGGAWTVRERKN